MMCFSAQSLIMAYLCFYSPSLYHLFLSLFLFLSTYICHLVLPPSSLLFPFIASLHSYLPPILFYVFLAIPTFLKVQTLLWNKCSVNEHAAPRNMTDEPCFKQLRCASSVLRWTSSKDIFPYWIYCSDWLECPFSCQTVYSHRKQAHLVERWGT